MKANKVESYSITALTVILGILATNPAKSQPITPSNDGTGTTVNQNGNQFNIQGGTHNGTNLFHSFDQFNVNSGQTANFFTTPDTRNILGRITGGDASIINGLIQVIGGNSNLFLMNPAGIMFGPNARLNVPASFSVTTATGIGFNSNNFWFQAMGTNDYANLVGNPSGYKFNVLNPGAIVNEGNLSLNPGENLTLLGGTVINTGQLSTAGGNVTIAAVEGGSTLRISQPGNLLSLEVGATAANGEVLSGINPLSLPELLTGGEITQATSMTVNGNGDVVLIDSNTIISGTVGDAIASGNIDVSTTSPLSKGGQGGSNIGGQVNVLGDRVALIGTNINASGINGGGTVLIGGDFQGNGIVPNSQQTFVNNNSFISADAITNGDGGQVIIWSDGVTNFSGNISATGGEFSGDGGFVEVSGKQQLIFDGNVNVSAAFGTPGIILLDPENITVGESENSENSENSESSESSETEIVDDNSEVASTENSESSETETVDDNSEVSSTENTDSPTTENSESSEIEIVDDNSEVSSTENTDSPTTENTESSETEIVDNNSEVPSTENTEENVDNSEITENTNLETEIADRSETTETETPIDPFAQDENSDVTISAENIEELSGDIILFADNDITINEKIETTESVELKAGRSININADIDTSIGNGNIGLFGNNNEMNIANRSEGKASINQLDGTTLNAGSGNIRIELGNLGEVGDINLANLTTTGQVLVNANGGNIARVSENSLINAGSLLFQTSGSGGIGLTDAPLQLNVENLEAVSGNGGAFFDVLGDVNIGDVSEDVDGIITAGGDIEIRSAGNVTLTESISTSEQDTPTVEQDALSSEQDALSSEQDALSSEQDALSSEQDALSSEQDALSSEQDALSSEQDALSSEQDALSSEQDAPTVENNSEVASTENTEIDIGTGGSINIEATGDIVATGSGIKASGESVSLSGTNITINDEFDESSGDTDVKLEATNNITVEDIADDVLEFLPGEGEIEFLADVDGDGIGAVTMLDNEADVDSDSNTIENGADTIKTNGRNLTIAGASLVLGNIDTSALPVDSGEELPATIDVDEDEALDSGSRQGNGGAIKLNAISGDILTSSLDSSSIDRDGGNIEINAVGDISTAEIITNSGEFFVNEDGITETGGSGNAGSISIESTGGSIDTTGGLIFAGSGSGDGGEINLTAQGDITTADINSSSESGIENFDSDAANIELKSGNGGAINLTTEGSITTGNINSSSDSSVKSSSVDNGTLQLNSGEGGEINLTAQGSITTGNINSSADAGIESFGSSGSLSFEGNSGDGGSIVLDSQSDITTSEIDSSSSSIENSGNGGSIILNSQSDITTSEIDSSSYSFPIFIPEGNSGNGGNITLNSIVGGDITTENIYADSAVYGNGNSGIGGSISINSLVGGNIVTGNLDSSSTVSGSGKSQDSGSIRIDGNGDITTGNLYSNSTAFGSGSASSGDGGSIIIEGSGDITTEIVSSSSTASGSDSNSGNGGDITMTAGSTITTELLDSYSYSSQGRSGNGGTISLRADTVKLNIPEFPDIEQLQINTFSVGTNGSGKGGDVNISTNNLSNAEILTLSSNSESGQVTIESKSRRNLLLNDLSIITSKQVNVSILTLDEITIDVGSTEGRSGNVNIFSSGNLKLNNVTIESDTKGDQDAGNVYIDSQKNITLDNTDIISITSAEGNAGNITLKTPQNIKLTNNSQLRVNTEGTGNAGSINIEANKLNLEQGTSLITETFAAGAPGDITINANTVDIGQDAQISATAVLGATNTGDGGNIIINTDELNIRGKLGIFAETEASANAGTLTLSPYEDNPDLNINFSNDGFISASTSSTGNGGNISISAPESIDIAGKGFISVETSDKGNAGTINIETQNLTLSDGVVISASTTDKGNAGAIEIDTEDFTLETGTSLTTETNNKGKAGDIEINTRKLTIGEDAQIIATAREGATNTEAGGNITINATDLLISGQLGIFAETAGETPAGTLTLNPYNRDGNPPLTPPRRGTGGTGEQGSRENRSDRFDSDLNITFTENGFISASTTSSGDGGNINISAPENINISGEGRITVETEGRGNAGIINIETENLTIAENTTISAATSDSGNGGSININPSESFQLEGQIITETTGAGDGGKITINTGELSAENSTISAKSTSTGNAGAIEIVGQENIVTGIIQSSASESSESKDTADGGDITITSEQGEINATQPIQSFSEKGNAGDVTLTAKTDVTTNTISSHGEQQGGQITIMTETGNIDTSNGFLANYSGDGTGGNVTLEASTGNITTSDIYSFADADGGQIFLKAGGDINITENSNVISASEPPEKEGERGRGGDAERGRRGEGETRRGGDIILEAGGNINTTAARIYSGADEGDTGTIDIVADDAIEVGQIELASGFVREERSVFNNFTLIPKPQGEATQGVAGNINITSKNGTIDTTAGVINSRSPDGTGDIKLNARENINAGKLEASALNEAQPTTGGNVEIISEQGGINSNQTIETFSEQGTAGNVNIQAEGSVNLENILSQGKMRGGDIAIESRNENSMDVQGELNTFSTDGIGGDVTLTSMGNISISGIRSEGIQQGGDITLVSEIGEIRARGDITSFSEEGRGGSIDIDAPESVNLEDVLSFGATDSGDLRIKSQTATVNTGNVMTQAADGPSGEVIINGSQITTGNLSSLGTVSSGIIQVEATDGSITTLDLESIASEGEAGGIDLDATGDISSEDQTVFSGDGDANIDIDAGGDVSVGNQEAIANQGDANIDIQTGGDINVENQTAQTNQGNANIDIQPVTNIPVQEQTVQVNQGNANIDIQPITNIPVQEQTVQVNQGNANIDIQPITNIPVQEQTTVSVSENLIINNIPNNTNTEEQIAIAPEAIETITNIDTGDIIIPVENLNDSTEIPVTTSTDTTVTQTDNNQSQSVLQPISNNSNFFTLTSPTNYNQTTNAGTAQEQTEASISTTTDTQQILKTINPVNTQYLITATASDQVVTMLERNSLQEYSDYLGADLEEKLISTQSVREILSDMANQTGKESAIVYINVYPEQLQIILYTKEGQPIIKTIPEVNREQIMKVALELRIRVASPSYQNDDSYLSPAQKLYSWLIAPIASELEAANIDTLLFSMDEGLRTLAVAALHDGEQFLIEKYSLSLIPSVSLMDTNYRSLQDTQVLAMGASEFIAHNSLPGVPIELEIVSQKLWQGSMFLNEDFTLKNLIAQRESYPYPIIHLATHADFRPGKISNSYIQLWGEEQIKLDHIRELGWNESSVELLVLSACRTAFGDKDAELGFAGLAIAAGVKSALASIWYVNDRATLALMTEFYSHLNQTKIKAEAVRQAQLAMLRGDVVIKGNQIRRLGERRSVELPSVLGEMSNRKLSHPYHWAGFTMVGSPW
ncbi:MAG: CHAT domain-containing protein [Okeania sp. SIO3B5]|uniref:CHAT domain-containing protein n=1 Tax=Okeania sp. SIO3B5 TaxID=2607811 RepID=UPI0013FF9994|nr:CHAT domain-containing protein [Okeania sp. SIO3B5]NEO53850.1 CHAT domain-containing protein [Okeania sp. SIO3B5]